VYEFTIKDDRGRDKNTIGTSFQAQSVVNSNFLIIHPFKIYSALQACSGSDTATQVYRGEQPWRTRAPPWLAVLP
jgi:hypothetical protein